MDENNKKTTKPTKAVKKEPKPKAPPVWTQLFTPLIADYNLDFIYNPSLTEDSGMIPVAWDDEFELVDSTNYTTAPQEYRNLLVKLAKSDNSLIQVLESKSLKSNDYYEFFSNDLINSELMFHRNLVSELRMKSEGGKGKDR